MYVRRQEGETDEAAHVPYGYALTRRDAGERRRFPEVISANRRCARATAFNSIRSTLGAGPLRFSATIRNSTPRRFICIGKNRVRLISDGSPVSEVPGVASGSLIEIRMPSR
jgi:hypothetical protein